LTVSGLSGEWYAVRVEATGQVGFVHSDSVVLTAEAPIARAYVNASGVNLRASNATSYMSFGKLERNTELTVYAMEKGWYRVRVDATGQMGYIIKNYVTVMTPNAVPPAAAATPTSAPTSAPSATDAPGSDKFIAYGEINALKVNFRTGPSTSTKSMGKLDRPARLGIYEKVGSWYRVHHIGLNKDGYVYAKYITLTSGGGSTETIGEAYLNASAVNIRTGPSTRYTSLGRLAKKTELTVLGSDGSWYRVRVDATGQEGYIFAKYVTLTGIKDTASQPAQTGRGTVNTGLLVLRDKPTSDGTAKTVGMVRMGYTVTVHSISGEWAYVTYNGMQGYCIARCIDMK